MAGHLRHLGSVRTGAGRRHHKKQTWKQRAVFNKKNRPARRQISRTSKLGSESTHCTPSGNRHEHQRRHGSTVYDGLNEQHSEKTEQKSSWAAKSSGLPVY